MNFNDPEDYAEYYANQLILQYIDKPKARETIKALARNMFINFNEMPKWRSLDDATGEALLAIAELFGVSGSYSGIDFHGRYFTTFPYGREGTTQYQEGFQSYFDAKYGFFLKYSDWRTALFN